MWIDLKRKFEEINHHIKTMAGKISDLIINSIEQDEFIQTLIKI